MDLAIRHGFESENLITRALNHIVGIGHKIKEKYNYLVHYETYIRQKNIQEHQQSRQQYREVTKKIADYLDEQSKYVSYRRKVIKKAESLKVEATKLKEFASLYQQSIVRDKKANLLGSEHKEELAHLTTLKPIKRK